MRSGRLWPVRSFTTRAVPQPDDNILEFVGQDPVSTLLLRCGQDDCGPVRGHRVVMDREGCPNATATSSSSSDKIQYQPFFPDAFSTTVAPFEAIASFRIARGAPTRPLQPRVRLTRSSINNPSQMRSARLWPRSRPSRRFGSRGVPQRNRYNLVFVGQDPVSTLLLRCGQDDCGPFDRLRREPCPNPMTTSSNSSDKIQYQHFF
ncbi:unnamed protein product [Phytophthora fragariaefolia]|uniref:Unnamed protein product n=1 Tax=Phytophthora fragariaefolia TaxID=1490495 RepID=A0A9W7D8M8_9STRA|nr:unnamed protein product [Phytophthora fragariaefolia]